MLIECDNPNCSLRVVDSFVECPGCGATLSSPADDNQQHRAADSLVSRSGSMHSLSDIWLIAVGIIGGFAVIVPVALAFLMSSVASQMVPADRKSPQILLSFSLQAAAWLPLLAAVFLLDTLPTSSIAEILLYGVALFWLLIRPNIVVAVGLAVYQFNAVANVLTVLQLEPIDLVTQRSTLVFVFFRVCAVSCMYVGIRKLILESPHIPEKLT